MKKLYSFKAKKTSGEEIELAIRRPTRMEADEADMMYSSFLSDCISKGILTKEMMLRAYKNFGGAMSEKEVKDYNKLTRSYYDIISKIEKTKKDSERESLVKQRDILWLAISEVNNEHEKLFSRTADSIAQNKVLLHLTLLLSLVKKNEEYVPLFSGSDFNERYENYSEMDESDPLDTEAVYSKVFTFVLFWYYSDRNIKEEDFEAYEKVVFPAEDAEEKVLENGPEQQTISSEPNP